MAQRVPWRSARPAVLRHGHHRQISLMNEHHMSRSSARCFKAWRGLEAARGCASCLRQLARTPRHAGMPMVQHGKGVQAFAGGSKALCEIAARWLQDGLAFAAACGSRCGCVPYSPLWGRLPGCLARLLARGSSARRAVDDEREADVGGVSSICENCWGENYDETSTYMITPN